MNRAIAAAMLCLCMVGTAWTEDIPNPAVHDSIWLGRLISNSADIGGVSERLRVERLGAEPWAALNPTLAREKPRRSVEEIERMRGQSPRWAAKRGFTAIERRSLQDPHRVNTMESTHTGDWWPALRDITVSAPFVADAYRPADRWRQGRGDGRLSDARALVDYTNQAERDKADGRLREIDPPFSTVLLLLGYVLIAMATIGRRGNPD